MWHSFHFSPCPYFVVETHLRAANSGHRVALASATTRKAGSFINTSCVCEKWSQDRRLLSCPLWFIARTIILLCVNLWCALLFSSTITTNTTTTSTGRHLNTESEIKQLRLGDVGNTINGIVRLCPHQPVINLPTPSVSVWLCLVIVLCIRHSLSLVNGILRVFIFYVSLLNYENRENRAHQPSCGCFVSTLLSPRPLPPHPLPHRTIIIVVIVGWLLLLLLPVTFPSPGGGARITTFSESGV